MKIIQLKGFIKRNFKLRVRNKLQIIFEAYQQALIIFVLILFNFLFVSEKLPPETYNFGILNENHVTVDLFINPDNIQTRSFGKILQTYYSFIEIKFFKNSKEMIQYYDSGNNQSSIDFFKETFGLEFLDFPNTYKLYHKYEPELFSNNKVNLFTNGNECRNTSYLYNLCAGNKLLYNGLAYLQYVVDGSIKKVYFFISKF